MKPKGVEKSITLDSIFLDEHGQQVHRIFAFPVKVGSLTQDITTLQEHHTN